MWIVKCWCDVNGELFLSFEEPYETEEEAEQARDYYIDTGLYELVTVDKE